MKSILTLQHFYTVPKIVHSAVDLKVGLHMQASSHANWIDNLKMFLNRI